MRHMQESEQSGLSDLVQTFLQGVRMMACCVFVTGGGFCLTALLYVLLHKALIPEKPISGTEAVLGFGFLGAVIGVLQHGLRLPVRRYAEGHARIGVGIVCMMILAMWFMVVVRTGGGYGHWLFYVGIILWLVAIWWMTAADTFAKFKPLRMFIISHAICVLVFTILAGLLGLEHFLRHGLPLHQHLADILLPCLLAAGFMVSMSANIIFQRLLYAQWVASSR